ncbi:hypothetical protein DP107_07380 [Haloglomus irregulare]|uniref:Uncharacterized protein n=1 Tax=Haloglomus irregulare TaxID=2234134 RepID=A0A554NBM8_9EURY|nr:hypothetical protein [Haloglomus irregulare]TSD14782.1 hypothetical protein DP107_07380 [Haloglomus irregulare]
MARFAYPCPDCRTTSNLHDADCEHDGTTRAVVERAYMDVLSALSRRPVEREDLPDAVPGEWSGLHADALGRLVAERRVVDDDGPLRLLTAAEYTELVREPTHEPLKTIYEAGSVPGAHDHSVFALVAYYEMVGLSWGETREQVVGWLRESGSWARGGWEESSPEEVVDDKQHVYERGYGWKQAAEEAKAVIDRRG